MGVVFHENPNYDAERVLEEAQRLMLTIYGKYLFFRFSNNLPLNTVYVRPDDFEHALQCNLYGEESGREYMINCSLEITILKDIHHIFRFLWCFINKVE